MNLTSFEMRFKESLKPEIFEAVDRWFIKNYKMALVNLQLSSHHKVLNCDILAVELDMGGRMHRLELKIFSDYVMKNYWPKQHGVVIENISKMKDESLGIYKNNFNSSIWTCYEGIYAYLYFDKTINEITEGYAFKVKELMKWVHQNYWNETLLPRPRSAETTDEITGKLKWRTQFFLPCVDNIPEHIFLKRNEKFRITTICRHPEFGDIEY